MNSLLLNNLNIKVQKIVSVLVLAGIMASLVVAVVPQRVQASGTSCYSWTFTGCCECWWPCRQDYNKRECYNGPSHWTEYNCACPSVCNYGC